MPPPDGKPHESHAGSPGSLPGIDPRRARAVRHLPQPMHLYAFLTRSGHYHFGCFQDGVESLADAMDRMVLRIVPHLVPGGRVLDVGCGMGSTTHILAGAGFPAVGIDPERRALAYAALGPAPAGGEGPVFENQRFQDRVRVPPARGERFENIVLLEVLQHLPPPGKLFEGCRRLLRPGGIMVVGDVALLPSLPWERVPFHRRGVLAAAGTAGGWTVAHREELTPLVLPTLDRLIHALEHAMPGVIAFFGDRRPEVHREAMELLEQWRGLREGFRNGDLVYELTVFRAPAGEARR